MAKGFILRTANFTAMQDAEKIQHSPLRSFIHTFGEEAMTGPDASGRNALESGSV